MQCETHFTKETSEEKVAKFFQQQVALERLSYFVVYYTQDYNAKDLHRYLSQSFPGTPFHGASSCKAIMTESGYHEGPVVGLFALYSDNDHVYGTGLVDKSSGDITDSVNAAIDMALTHADRVGEVPNLILLHATPGQEEHILKCIDERFGTAVPLIGGSAADNTVNNEWSVLTTQGASHSGVSLTAFFSDNAISIGFSAGHIPTQVSGVATQVDGRNLKTIDDRPALEVYKEWTELHLGDEEEEHFFFELAAAYPLGRQAGSVFDQPYYKLSHPIREIPGGGIELFTDVQQGETLYLMQGCKEQLVSRSARVINATFNQKLEPSLKVGVINIFCAGPMLNLQQNINDVCQQIKDQLGEIAFICPFTFGEQGRFIGGECAHGNLMISSAIFHKPYES